MIRITQIRDGLRQKLFVEGTLSDGWVEALETSWSEAESQLNREPLIIDLAGVTYVDDKGRALLARILKSGAELHATGIMTRAVVEEVTKMNARDRLIEKKGPAAKAGDGDWRRVSRLAQSNQRVPARTGEQAGEALNSYRPQENTRDHRPRGGEGEKL